MWATASGWLWLAVSQTWTSPSELIHNDDSSTTGHRMPAAWWEAEVKGMNLLYGSAKRHPTGHVRDGMEAETKVKQAVR